MDFEDTLAGVTANIELLYSSENQIDDEVRKKADSRLRKFQNEPMSWNICVSLLERRAQNITPVSDNVALFAARTLRYKLVRQQHKQLNIGAELTGHMRSMTERLVRVLDVLSRADEQVLNASDEVSFFENFKLQ